VVCSSGRGTAGEHDHTVDAPAREEWSVGGGDRELVDDGDDPRQLIRRARRAVGDPARAARSSARLPELSVIPRILDGIRVRTATP
jgi:hypothetical protein